MKERCENLDGIRTFAALGIICMHVLILGQFPSDTLGRAYKVIAGMGILVRIFFILSGFGMCCGYYEKMKSGTADLNVFFSRRYLKIWPFFVVLVCIDVFSEAVIGSGVTGNIFFEAFSNLTLLFGFLPGKDFQVMGIGWTLGVVFGFYCLFPFFTFALWTKRRAWFSFLVSIAFNCVCKAYFTENDIDASHICLQWACYFVAGGLIYLYRDRIIQCNRLHPWAGWISIAMGLFVSLTTFPGGQLVQTLKSISCFAMIITGAMSDRKKLLANAFTRIISDISLEIYLSHVFILRVMQKAGIVQRIHNHEIAYIVMVLTTVFGTIAFSLAFRFVSVKMAQKKKDVQSAHRVQ